MISLFEMMKIPGKSLNYPFISVVMIKQNLFCLLAWISGSSEECIGFKNTNMHRIFFLIYLSNTELRLTHLCCYLSTPLLWQDECDSTWLLPFIKPQWITIWTDIICNGIQRYFIYTCGSIFIIKNMLWGTLHWHVLKTIWMLNLY